MATMSGPSSAAIARQITASSGPDDLLFTVQDGVITATGRDGAILGIHDSLSSLWGDVVDEGMRVRFAAGTFAPTAALTVPAGVQIHGAGAGTIIQRSGVGDTFSIIGTDGSRLAGVTISDLTITGPSVSGTQVQGRGVYANYYADLTVTRCAISGFGSLGDDAGIALNIGTNATIERNDLTANKNGICGGAPTATTDIRAQRTIVDRNRCWANYDDGIHFQRCARTIITNNICWSHPGGGSSDGAGIDLLGDEYDIVRGNICFDNARGIEVGNTANASYPDIGHVITGNICEDNSEYGMSVIAASARCTIAGNTVEGNGTNGIRFGTATNGQSVVDVVIDGNQIHDNGAKGIDCFGYLTRPVVRNNVLSGHSTCDIHVRTSTGTPSLYALLDNRTLSETGIDDDVSGEGAVTRLFGA